MNAPRLSIVVLCVIFLLLGGCAAPAATPAAPAAEAVPAAEAPPAPPAAEAPPIEDVAAAMAGNESIPPNFEEVSPQLCPPDTNFLLPVTIIGEPTNNRYNDSYFTIETEYQNPENSQVFRLNITSQDPDRALRFAEELMVCFETVDTDVPDTTAPEEGQEGEFSAVTPLWEEVLNNPAGIIVETFWLPDETINPENYAAIFYAIDPTIDTDGQDGFQAKCALSASSRPKFLSGSASASVTATLYKRGSYVGSSTVSASSPGAELSDSNGKYRTVYDTIVGGNVGTKYSLSGSWIENNSGKTSSLSWCKP